MKSVKRPFEAPGDGAEKDIYVSVCLARDPWLEGFGRAHARATGPARPSFYRHVGQRRCLHVECSCLRELTGGIEKGNGNEGCARFRIVGQD